MKRKEIGDVEEEPKKSNEKIKDKMPLNLLSGLV